MRARVVFVIGVVMCIGVVALVARDSRADNIPCDVCNEQFAALQEDILVFVPTPQQTSFLERVALTEQFLYPPNPTFPPNPCAANAELGSIGASTQGLANAGQIGADGEEALVGDVTNLDEAIRTAYPSRPCFELPGTSN